MRISWTAKSRLPSSGALVDSSPALQRPSKAAIVVPVLAFIGAAVEYSRAVQARTSLQVALDSAAFTGPLH
ncbi:Tad domain-containing protein [Bradyrhizobium sp. I71]|nr:Tad domain-containing protein [Bradyrhizobium sp. I71]